LYEAIKARMTAYKMTLTDLGIAAFSKYLEKNNGLTNFALKPESRWAKRILFAKLKDLVRNADEALTLAQRRRYKAGHAFTDYDIASISDPLAKTTPAGHEYQVSQILLKEAETTLKTAQEDLKAAAFIGQVPGEPSAKRAAAAKAAHERK
jgi:hypothetical protein